MSIEISFKNYLTAKSFSYIIKQNKIKVTLLNWFRETDKGIKRENCILLLTINKGIFCYIK